MESSTQAANLSDHSPPALEIRLFGPLQYDGRSRTHFFAAYEYDTILDSALIDTLRL
jgi:hypothetical protein